MMILAMLMILLSVAHSQQQCQNGGVTIMVRERYAPHSISYLCLCPFMYTGDLCDNFREIYCYLEGQNILSQSISIANPFTLQFQIQCYLKKMETVQNNERNKQNNFIRLPMTKAQIDQEEKFFYNTNNQLQVVWANNSKIFNSFGQIIKDKQDNRSDDEILQSYPHYKFNYTDQFFGLPLLNTRISYKLQAIRFRKQNVQLGISSLELDNTTNTNKTKKKVKLVTDPIKQDLSQYGVTRLQLQMSMHYGADLGIFHRAGMNTAKWRVNDQNFPKGQILSINKFKISGSVYVLIAFFMIFATFSGGKIIVKYYKKFKSNKNLKQFQQQSQIRKLKSEQNN